MEFFYVGSLVMLSVIVLIQFLVVAKVNTSYKLYIVFISIFFIVCILVWTTLYLPFIRSDIKGFQNFLLVIVLTCVTITIKLSEFLYQIDKKNLKIKNVLEKIFSMLSFSFAFVWWFYFLGENGIPMFILAYSLLFVLLFLNKKEKIKNEQ